MIQLEYVNVKVKYLRDINQLEYITVKLKYLEDINQSMCLLS